MLGFPTQGVPGFRVRDYLGNVTEQQRRLIDLAQSPDPKVALAAIRELRVMLDEYESRAVPAARRAGLSWDAIGELLGRHKTSVWERFAKETG